MLSDVALRSIADNLAALRLDPLLQLKIAVAVVGPLMGGDATMPDSEPLAKSDCVSGPVPIVSSSPSNRHSPRKKAARSKKARVRKGKPEPIPIVYNGKIFPSRSEMAKHLAPILGKSATTLARALLDAGDDAEAVVRRYQAATEGERNREATFRRGRNQEFSEPDLDPPPKRPPAPSPEMRARQWLEDRLALGPIVATDFEDAISRHEFDSRSAEQAKAKLGLVARRVNNGRGAVVHLCTEAQAAELEA